MIDLVKNNVKELQDLCARYHVKSLHLFGSAAKGEHNSNTSDLDFVVEFNESIDPVDYADNFFGLLNELKQLFKKDVDLLSQRALRNPIMISEINSSKVQLYAA